MKTILVLLFSALLVAHGQSRVEMLLIDYASPTNTIEIQANEVASLKKWYEPGTFNSALVVQVGNHPIKSGCNNCPAIPLPIKGPTRISLVALYPTIPETWAAYALLEITPVTFPPDKTVVIPEGGGANIAMECSTNLIDWAAAPLGVYTNQPAVKFFRLRAERLP